jgi:Mn2+/Fe2+ NRAMP family transporter
LITNLPNIVNGLMLPLLLPLLLILANDKRVLGRYRNGLFTNALSAVVFVFLSGVTLIFLASIFFPGLFHT